MTRNNRFIIIIFSLFLLVGLAISIYQKDVLSIVNPSGNISNNQTVIHRVSLFEDRASPNALAIKVGEEVQFNTRDGKSHHLSSGAGKAYDGTTGLAEEQAQDMSGHGHKIGESQGHNHIAGVESGIFGADEAYKVQFKEAGTYEFHDHLNPKIFITIIVYEQMRESNK